MDKKVLAIIFIVFLYTGCYQTRPQVIRNAGTETTQVNGITTASMRHQSCFKAGRETICSDSNGNQIMNKVVDFFQKALFLMLLMEIFNKLLFNQMLKQLQMLV